ncbi:phage holin family protein, partial [Candidatus Parcubacteria bacterium]
ALIAALILGLLNAIIRPVLLIITLPINILTLGLFTFIINAFLIWFMPSFVKGVEITGFMPALMAAIILWAVSVVVSYLLQTKD